LKSRVTKWIKGHRRLAVTLLTLTMALILALAVLPAHADWSLDYPDVTGTYLVAGGARPVELDNTRHPRVQFSRLIITTQTGKAITDATLEHMGADIALTGMVGPGRRSTIVLGGTDSDGTVTAIQGRVITNRDGDVVSLKGRMMTYVTSDGERKVNAGTGTAAISVAAYHSEPLSTLITQGAGAGSVGIQLNNIMSRFKLSQLATLRSGQIGFWFNLQESEVEGPYIGLRFVPAGVTETDLFPADPVGHVDVTVMPYQGYTGTGDWVECDLTSASGRVVYYGNDPTDGTAFSWEEEGGNYTLADVEALINAETAMTVGGDNASRWMLSTIYIVLYEGGVRTCYIDDITVDGQLYTLEPNSYYAGFRAIMQE